MSNLKNTNSTASFSNESLYSNYFAYLRDARQKIASCQIACSDWSRKYENEEEINENEELGLDDTDNENDNFDECYEDDGVVFDSNFDKDKNNGNTIFIICIFIIFLF